MNLKLTAFIPWMVIAGMAHGQVRNASVLYTYKESQPQQAYRLGDECFVPLDTLSNWGWIIDRQVDSVNVTAEGHTVNMDIRNVAGKSAIALRKAVGQLGGQTAWTPGTDTLNVFSQLTLISVNGNNVHAEGRFSFRGSQSFISPSTTIIDLEGARVSNATREDVPSNVQVSQYGPNTVRLSIPTTFSPKAPAHAIPAAPQFDYQIVPGEPTVDYSDIPQNSDGNSGYNSNTNYSNSGMLTVTVDRDEDPSAVIQVHVPDPLPGQVLVNRADPLTLILTFPVDVQLPASSAFITSKTLASVTTTPSGGNTLVTLHLTRPMNVEVINESNGVTVNLLNRSGAAAGNGRLAGKVIVVDAGHGGYDRGAHVGDVNEKDINLPVARKIAADLEAAGATVIVTRSDDTFIPLLERSSISNRNHADLFISCHVNSTGGAPTQTGTITFYHKSHQVSMYLAQCIQHEIAKVNGLPDLGVWSDSRIYTSGFSVLRNTNAPAVLIELGFINYPRDRARMLTTDFQDSVAAAVVKGARVFFGETKPQ